MTVDNGKLLENLQQTLKVGSSSVQENMDVSHILRQHSETMQNKVPRNIRKSKRNSTLPCITIWNQQPKIVLPKINSNKKSQKKSTSKKYQYKPKEYNCFGKTMKALYLVEDDQ